MFASVLIANRGEIACRIARTARRLGLRTIAVYSEADAGAPHVRVCDEAHPIGPAAARESYLAIDKLIELARATRRAMHPSRLRISLRESRDSRKPARGRDRVRRSAAGRDPRHGIEGRAKALMEKAGVPVVPGYHGERQDEGFFKEKAYADRLPGADQGGGGRRRQRHAPRRPSTPSSMLRSKARNAKRSPPSATRAC